MAAWTSRRLQRWVAALVLAAIVNFASPAARANTAATPVPAARATCEGDPDYSVLDFWVGEWDVRWNEEWVGVNRIVKVLGGCAVQELWRDARGREAWSLFYREPVSGSWKQVFVTDEGPIKEKVLISGSDAGAVRFQGVLVRPDGSRVLDRTTLLALPDGGVRQVIEQSADGGASWRVVFDGRYLRRTPD